MNSNSKWYIVARASRGISGSKATTFLNRGKNVDIKQYTVRAV